MRAGRSLALRGIAISGRQSVIRIGNGVNTRIDRMRKIIGLYEATVTVRYAAAPQAPVGIDQRERGCGSAAEIASRSEKELGLSQLDCRPTQEHAPRANTRSVKAVPWGRRLATLKEVDQRTEASAILQRRTVTSPLVPFPMAPLKYLLCLKWHSALNCPYRAYC